MNDRFDTALAKAYSGAVYDVLRALGHPAQVLPSTIRPLSEATKLSGPVFTVAGEPCDIGPRESLLAWTRMLSRVPAGSVVVCQPNDSSLAHMGELSAETFQLRQVRGYIVDGGCRDTEYIGELGFPVFCRYRTPVDVVARWAPTALGETISIGGVGIRTNDWVFADRDGVVIIPAEAKAQVLSGVENVLGQENLVRKAIRGGADPEAAYLQYGKF